jgi:hypothetical protein
MIELPSGMVRHLTIEFAIDWDGAGWHVRNSTQTHGLPWGDSYKAILMVRDDLQRQIDERFNCPFHPKALKQQGLPEWASEESS